MSYEERRSSRKTKRILYYIFLGLVVCFIVFVLARLAFDVSDETVLPLSILYYDKIDAVGFPLLRQKIYSVGEIESSEIYYKEGERVPAGVKLALLSQFNVGDENRVLMDELRKINRRLSGTNGFTSETYFSSVSDLQRTIQNGLLEDLVQKELSFQKADTDSFFAADEFESSSMANLDEKALLERKKEIESLIKTEQKAVYSEFGGIVSYFLTTADQLFSLESMEHFSYADFEEVELKFNETESQKKKGLRLIDNFSSVVVLKIDDATRISKLSPGQRVRLFHERIGEVEAVLKKKAEENGKGILFLKVNKELHKFYSVGFTNFSLILDKMDSYQLPLQALISDERGEGVYINYKSGIVKYRPVSVLAKDDDFIYVSKGNRSGKILLDSTGEMHYTIGRFDPVYIHPELLSENVIVQ